jgi:hypothetical protein
MKKKSQKAWTERELRLLKKYYPVGGSPLVRQKLKANGYDDRSKSAVSGRAWNFGLKSPLHHKPNSGCFKPGQAAHNKGAGMSEETKAKVQHTWFKKGEDNHKTLEYDFAISYRIGRHRTSNDYWNIRISKAKWVHLHVWSYLQHNDEPPKGWIIGMKDKPGFDAMVRSFGFTEQPPKQEPAGQWQRVCELAKAVQPFLECLPREENMRRNSASLRLTDGYVAAMLTMKEPEIRETLIKEHPQLIQANRQRIINQRQIKSQQQS